MATPKPSKSPKVEPIVSKLAPNLSAIPALLLTGKVREASWWKKYWWVVALGVLIIAGIVWFLWPKGPNFVADEVDSTTTRPVLYRATTIPAGTIALQADRARLDVTGLSPLATEGQTYALILAELAPNWAVENISSTNSWNLGDFNVLPDGSFEILREPQRFDLPENMGNPNTALVVVSQDANMAVVLAGDIDPATTQSYPLTFPASFTATESSLVLQDLAGEDTTKPKLTFVGLPKLSQFGWRYEARFGEFVTQLPTTELVLGQFDGAGDATTLQEIVFAASNLSKFTDLAISLEPLWDTDPAISAIKPFSALLEPAD